jgi:hypothetical protein
MSGCMTVGATGYTCGTCDAGWMGTNCDMPVTCTGAAAPTNGTVSAMSATAGNSVTYACNTGYTLNGTAVDLCQANGTFASPAPTCAASPCSPNLTAPANGTVSTTMGTTGTIATYSCNQGYVLSGSATQTCQASGTWSGTAPTCTLVTTGCTPDPCVHSMSGCMTVGATGYTCGTCVAGWTGANCSTPVTCSGATAPANGAVSGGGSATFGNTVTYSCNAGYTLTGNATATCQANGTFTGPAPTCTPVNCGAPPTVTNAGAPTVSGGASGGSTDTLGATAAYTCNQGYVLNGANSTCGASGMWSSAPTCGAISCGAPPQVANAGAPVVSGGDGGGATDTYGATAAYTCNTGFKLAGANPTCGLNGSWGAPPTCGAISCGAPPQVANAGAPVVSGGDGGGATDTYGATATYTCNTGYKLTGADPTCGLNGAWGAAPTCTATSCGTFTDVVYSMKGALTISGAIAGNGTYPVGTNTSLPKFQGAGDTTPFTVAGYPTAWIRLRFTNDATGTPMAGTVDLVEFFMPVQDVVNVAGTTVTANACSSVGLLAGGIANCGGGDAACTKVTPTISRPCTAHGAGTLAGTALKWGACTPAPSGTASWNFTAAGADGVTGAGCAAGMNQWGNVSCAGGLCGALPAAELGDAYQTWNQELGTFTFSSANYKTATFTAPAVQIPNATGDSVTTLAITSTTVFGTYCGSTPGTDLVCNVE